MGGEFALRIAKSTSALVLVRDESVREVVATALSELSRLLVFQTGSVNEAKIALRRDPEVLVLGPDWRDREIEELLEQIGEDAPAIVLLVTEGLPTGPIRRDVVAIEAPFDLDRLGWAIDEAVSRRHGARSGKMPRSDRRV